MKLHLQHIYVERFGGLADCAVGPFGKGLNIVYGPNEAGKSTLAAFVGGVLFGWEEAHGVRNRYVPSDGGRAGSLVFSGDEATGQSEELARDELGARGLTPVWSSASAAVTRI